MSLAFWDLLQAINTIGGDLMMFAAWGGYANREKIRRWMTRNHFPKEIGHPLDNAMQWDALVFPVSKAEVPRWVIQRLKPKRVGLIASVESRAYAEQIAADARTREVKVSIKIIDEPNDPAQSRAALHSLALEMHKQGCKTLAVDLTGGKVTMSLGAFMAAEELGLHSLYVATQFDQALKQPDLRTAEILCISKPQ